MERKIKVLEETLAGAQEEADKARAELDKVKTERKKTLAKEDTLKKSRHEYQK